MPSRCLSGHLQHPSAIAAPQSIFLFILETVFSFSQLWFSQNNSISGELGSQSCTQLRPHTKAGEGSQRYLSRRQPFPRAASRHPTQGQHQSAGLNVNSQCASCVLVCKFVCPVPTLMVLPRSHHRAAVGSV